MSNRTYELNNMSFVAGETQDLFLRLYTTNDTQVSAEDSECNFSIMRYGASSTQLPLLSKNCEIVTESVNGENLSYFHIKLMPEDTVNLHGSFLYQVTLKTLVSVEVYQGLLNIHDNINRAFVLN